MADIRWFWGKDAEGRRVTTAEAIGVKLCEHCHNGHPAVELTILRPGEAPPSRAAKVTAVLRVLHPSMTPVEVTSSEWPPDDLAEAETH